MSAFNVSLFDSRPAIAIIRHLTLSQVKFSASLHKQDFYLQLRLP